MLDFLISMQSQFGDLHLNPIPNDHISYHKRWVLNLFPVIVAERMNNDYTPYHK